MPVNVKYKTERCDWRTYEISEDTKRVNVPTSANGRGYEFRVRLENTTQNARLILRGLRCQIRRHGRGGRVETT